MIALRRIKFIHILYNLFHYKKLKYQALEYKKYGIKKRIFSSLSSSDLPEDTESNHPWLDKEDSAIALPKSPSFTNLDESVKSAIINWTSDGYAILRGFFTSEKVEEINQLLTKLMEEENLPVKDKRKIMYAVRYSSKLKDLVNSKGLTDILNLLMGNSVDLYQSVNFLKGSEEPTHSDFIHLSTYPYGYLIAVWIALEDIDEENGPVFYYPGSHHLPYVMSKDFDHGGDKWIVGKNFKSKYINKVEAVLEKTDYVKKVFTAKKGDVLIWHANMLHGGDKVINQERTRKSMVMHYFGKNVIRYHEISQRPSLIW